MRGFSVFIVLFILFGQIYLVSAVAEERDSGLILYFKFDNQASYKENGSFVYDFSAKGNNGRVYGAAWNRTGGVRGGAFEFDGKDDKISIKDADSLSPSTTKHFTIAFWVKFKRTKFTGEGNVPDYLHFLGKGSADDGYEYVFRQYNSSNSEDRGNRISFYLFNLQGGLGSGGYVQEPINGDWNFYVGVLNGTRIQLWKNGVLKDSTPLSEYGVIIKNGKAPFNIGTLDGDSYFKGAIDELRIYNKSLSKKEIADLYNFNYAVSSNASIPKTNVTVPKVNITTPKVNSTKPANTTILKSNTTLPDNSTSSNQEIDNPASATTTESSTSSGGGGGGITIKKDTKKDSGATNEEVQEGAKQDIYGTNNIEKDFKEGVVATGRAIEYLGEKGQSAVLWPSRIISGSIIIFILIAICFISYLLFRDRIMGYIIAKKYNRWRDKGKVLNNLVELHNYG